jgi:hypothetical protein
MHWIGPTLLVLSLILLPLALRGRLTARGLFCRRCKFDLQGLDPARPDPTCPECGRDLAQPKSTKPTLRRAHRPALAAASILLLAGITLTAITATNNTNRILAALPDRVVLTLHALGVEAAFTEIATNRLTRIPPLDEAAWRDLIEAALAHQADTNTPWDPRHGEVLQHAFTSARMTPDEIAAYFTHGTQSTVNFPASLRHGSNEIGIQLVQTNSPRLASLNGTNGILHDGTDTVWTYLSLISANIGEQGVTPPGQRIGLTGFDIPGPAGGGMGSMGFKIPLENLNWHAIPQDADLPITVHYEVGIRRMSDNHKHQTTRVSTTHPVRILPPNADLITLNTNPDTVNHFANNPTLRISPVHLHPVETRSGNRIADLTLITANCPVAISGQLVAVHEGRDYPITHFTRPAYNGYSINSFAWTIDTPPDESIINAWIAAGRITIELRPDPRHAEKTPGITEILGVPLRFENAKVSTTPPPAATQTSAPHPDQTTARPITPQPPTEPTNQPNPQDNPEG